MNYDDNTPVLEDGESTGVFTPFHAEPGSAGSPSSSTGCPHLELAPGQRCPGCNWRKPYPKTQTSPKTKTFGMRIPVDEIDTFRETVDTAAEYIGVSGQPQEEFKVLSLAVAYLLQDEGLRGFGRR